jgi:PEGA domain
VENINLFLGERKTPSMRIAAIFLAALASAHSTVCSAQACPIEIEGVSQQAIKSEMGTFGTAMKVTYRNVSTFPVRGIEFGIQALSTDNGVSRPSSIMANHELAPNAVDSLLWNATRFDKQNTSKPIYIIWPATVVMGDGSKLGGSAKKCGYRTEQSDRTGKAAVASVEPTPASNPSNSTRQLEDLVNSGKASLVNAASDPPGASLDVDEKLIGKTPLSFVLIGTHNGAPRSILIYKEGYSLSGHDVTPNGKTITLNEKLTALTNR